MTDQERRDDSGQAAGSLPSSRTEWVDPRELTLGPPGPVTLSDREGVFAHSFKCGGCQLEFVLMSWVRDRHDAYNTYCPECGQVTAKVHWRTTLSEQREFSDDPNSAEIFNVVPLGANAQLVSFPDRD